MRLTSLPIVTQAATVGAKLTITSPATLATAVTFGNTATIGRSPSNTMCVPSRKVTREHAIIRRHNLDQRIIYQIRDLGSSNGTYVNDQRVIMPVPLASGARIRVADTEMIFLQEEDNFDDEHLIKTTKGNFTAMNEQFNPQPVALLISDIREFTRMSGVLSVDVLATFVQCWLRESGHLVTASGGTVDKFIGDAMLAYWGGHAGHHASQCHSALQTAGVCSN
jgi:adenylate cyclase